MNRIHWLSPGDPTQRTGGYLYNARIASALREQGVDVVMHVLNGSWPWPSASYAETLGALPNDAVVIADGLLWPGLDSDERADLCRRCTVWVVLHSLLDKEQDSVDGVVDKEVSALLEAHGWFATSHRMAKLISERAGVPMGSVVIPGTEATSPAQSAPVHRFLNVAHVIPRKNQTVLLEALSQIDDLAWKLDIVGSLERNPEHAALIQQQISTMQLGERVRLLGELDAQSLDSAYAHASCLIHTADFEAFGMVLTEALARGLSVISTPAGALDNIDSGMVHQIEAGDVEGLTQRIRSHLQGTDSIEQAPLVFPTWAEQATLLIRVLGLEEEGFSVDWLRMREPYDHAARSQSLAQAFEAALGEGPQRVMEIATGLGSGTRFLTQYFERDVEWFLVDRDPQLLASLERDMVGRSLQYQTVQHDLRNLNALNMEVDGVTTQALLDLVSHDWLEVFADWLTVRRIPFLGALSVDGRVSWMPVDSRDEAVQHAFRTHQTWDRGFGPSPGPEAATTLKRLLEERGFRVRLERADWAIPAADNAMVSAMVEGIASAAREAAQDAGVESSIVDSWRDERLSQVGQLSIQVGHWDLLAIP